MKQNIKIILSILMVFCIGFFAQAQSDSTNLQATEQFNTLLETVILPAIFSILGATGINVSPFSALITVIVMWLIRRYEKNRLTKKITKQITGVDPVENTENRNRIQRFFDRLKGK